MEVLFMADLLPNGLHEKAMICSTCYITEVDQMYSLLRKFPWKSSTDERKGVWSKLTMVFTLNVPFICYLSTIIINVL